MNEDLSWKLILDGFHGVCVTSGEQELGSVFSTAVC